MRICDARRAVPLLALLLALAPLLGEETERLLKTIKAVGREGAGNPEATRAWQELVRAGADKLPLILAAMDDADAVTTNWLRNAVDTVAERELKAGRKLPAEKLEAFIKDSKHSGRARRTAYEWLIRADPSAPDRLLPGMVQDPSAELRRDAVARAVREAEEQLKNDDKNAAKTLFEKAFAGARDRDQVDQIAKQLKALGVEVELPKHFGFVQQWLLIAPFDNSEMKGFDQRYPPEERVEPARPLAGKAGAEARWKAHATADPYGVVDLNKVLGKQKGVVAYGYAAVQSPAERPVEIRVGCITAVKVWLNGKPVLAVDEYHHGMRMDQYVGFGTLKAGRNEILVKVCQNEQKEEWAQMWSFQLRLCDAVGGGVPFSNITDREPAAGGRGQ